MKILFVANEYIQKGKPTTGFPNYLYRVSKALVELGHKPIIVAGGNKNSRTFDENVEIFTVKVPYRNYNNQCINKVLNAIEAGLILNNKVKEVIRINSVDIIQFPSLGGLALFYRGKVPAVMRLSSYAKTYFSSYQTLTAKTVSAMAMMERLSGRRCRAIFSPCKNTADAFGNDCNRKVAVIETPFINDVKKYGYEYYYKYLVGKKYVLFFGTLYAEKGILVIAEILEKFLDMNPEYYFVFIGDSTNLNGIKAGTLLESAAGKYRERIVVNKALPHEQLYPVISGADFVVLPSLMDNFPNACIEAMYFGKVVIGTDGASFEQLISHGINGLLCRIGDSTDLFEKMQYAVGMDKTEKNNIEGNARKRITKLRPEYVVKRLLHFYECVINYEK